MSPFATQSKSFCQTVSLWAAEIPHWHVRPAFTPWEQCFIILDALWGCEQTGGSSGIHWSLIVHICYFGCPDLCHDPILWLLHTSLSFHTSTPHVYLLTSSKWCLIESLHASLQGYSADISYAFHTKTTSTPFWLLQPFIFLYTFSGQRSFLVSPRYSKCTHSFTWQEHGIVLHLIIQRKAAECVDWCIFCWGSIKNELKLASMWCASQVTC